MFLLHLPRSSTQTGDPDVIYSDRGDCDSATEISINAILSVSVLWKTGIKEIVPIRRSACFRCCPQTPKDGSFCWRSNST